MDGKSITAAFVTFTDYQAYFEYHSTHCCEAIGKPLAVLYKKDMQRFQRGVSPRHGSSDHPGLANHISMGYIGCPPKKVPNLF